MVKVTGEKTSDVGGDKSENPKREAGDALEYTETRHVKGMKRLTIEQRFPQRTTRTNLQTTPCPG
jgi:hypothetical protein